MHAQACKVGILHSHKSLRKFSVFLGLEEFELCIAGSSDMQSIRAKEHDNSFPYVSLAKTNRYWQLSHQNNLEAVNTGARASSRHEEEYQAQTGLCTRE